MKKILFLLVIFTTAFSFGQEWKTYLPKNKPERELTLFDYQNAFKQYELEYHAKNGKYQNKGEEIELPGYKEFKRWEWYWEQRVNPFTGEFPEKTDWEILQEHKQQFPSMYNRRTNANWTSLAPTSYTNWGNSSGLGRVSSIGFHPTDPNIFFVGSNSGGLWKTTDGGQTYVPLTDNIGYESIEKIYIPNDYPTTHTFYILVGNVYYASYSHDARLSRIFKTTDGGQTWTGLSIGYSYPVSNTLPYSYARIYDGDRFQVDPNNSNRLWVKINYSYYSYTSYDGWYESTDGGDTWTLINHHIGSAFHPTNPDIQYDCYMDYNSHQMRFTKTTDGGLTWNNGYPSVDDSTHQQRHIGVSPDQPDVVYLLKGTAWNSGTAQLWKSTDAGETFTYINLNPPYLYQYCGGGVGRPSGNGALAVNPLNADELYAGAIVTYHSLDGGYTWTCGNGSHADKHFFGFQPVTNDFFEGNDGGVAKQISGQSTSINLSQQLQISQVYRMGISATNPDEYLFGCQDNGTIYHSSITNDWKHILCCDGMDCAIDPNNENIQYGSTQGAGGFYRTTDKWQTRTNIRSNFPSGFIGAWTTPLKLSHNDSNTFFVLGNGPTNLLIKTTDGGNTFSTIGNGGRRAFDVAPSNDDVIYVASDAGLSMNNYGTLMKTTDGGQTWTDVNNIDHPYNSLFIHALTIKSDDENTVWAASSVSFIYNNYNSGIFKTTDGGQTWTDITENLPANRINTIVYNEQNTSETEIYVGTNGGGVYVKRNDEPWVPFMTGLTSAPITDLEIYYDTTDPSNSRIRAATYGRGLWESKLYDGNGLSVNETQIENISIYPNPTNDFLNIKSKDLIKNIVFYNLLGQKILNYTIEEKKQLKIDISNLPVDTYVIKIILKNGNKQVMKVIKM